MKPFEHQTNLEIAFQQQSVKQRYTHSRGLYAKTEHRNGESFAVAGYNDLTAKVNGKKLDQLIAERIEEKGTISVLDIGCGNGQFLLDGYNKWGAAFKGTGLTAFRYNSQTCNRECCDDIEMKHYLADIPIVLGDAQKVDTQFEHQSFDLVTAVWLSSYLADSWAMVTGINRLLVPDGIAFVTGFQPNVVNGLSANAESMLKQQGFDFLEGVSDESNLTLNKTVDDIQLPIKPINFAQLEFNRRIILFEEDSLWTNCGKL